MYIPCTISAQLYSGLCTIMLTPFVRTAYKIACNFQTTWHAETSGTANSLFRSAAPASPSIGSGAAWCGRAGTRSGRSARPPTARLRLRTSNRPNASNKTGETGHASAPGAGDEEFCLDGGHESELRGEPRAADGAGDAGDSTADASGRDASRAGRAGSA